MQVLMHEVGLFMWSKWPWVSKTSNQHFWKNIIMKLYEESNGNHETQFSHIAFCSCTHYFYCPNSVWRDRNKLFFLFLLWGSFISLHQEGGYHSHSTFHWPKYTNYIWLLTEWRDQDAKCVLKWYKIKLIMYISYSKVDMANSVVSLYIIDYTNNCLRNYFHNENEQ